MGEPPVSAHRGRWASSLARGDARPAGLGTSRRQRPLGDSGDLGVHVVPEQLGLTDEQPLFSFERYAQVGTSGRLGVLGRLAGGTRRGDLRDDGVDLVHSPGLDLDRQLSPVSSRASSRAAAVNASA